MSRLHPGYGLGEHALSIPPELEPCGLDQAALTHRLLTLFGSAAYSPPRLPSVALELLQITRNPKVDVAAVVALLSRDPMLAGQVLHLCGTARYARGAPPRSLNDAVVRLGIARMTDIFLQVSLEARIFRAPRYAEALEELRRHSKFTAEAARLVARQTTGLDEHAFLCGLLHDVGTAASALALAGPLKDLAPAGFDVAWPCIFEVHASCSAHLARLWGLPTDISLVLSMHHGPMSDGRVHPVAAAVHFADLYSERVGLGFMTDSTLGSLDAAAKLLGLSGRSLSELTASLDELAKLI